MERERRKKEDRKKRRRRVARPFSSRKEAKEGKRERGEGLKKAPQHKVKCLPTKGGLGSEHEAAMGQTRWLEGFLIEHLLEWVF